MVTLPLKDLQDAIARTISDHEKAYEVAEMCTYFGLSKETTYDPWQSKRLYVLSLIKYEDLAFLIDLAEKVIDRYQSDELRMILSQYVGGVTGDIKNIIFAANGPKPEIVLTDAVHNTVDIVENAQYCLVYDKPINSKGLRWIDLINWWVEKSGEAAEQAILSLYLRLKASLGSPVEVALYETYYSVVFKDFLTNHEEITSLEKFPALLPQVYLHYDPKTLKQLQGQRRIPRERMDFLILFSDKDRVVLEVDGKQHYAKGDLASPQEYANMVAEDRKLRLRGYEMYRFGGYELFNLEVGQTILADFFRALFEKHSYAFR